MRKCVKISAIMGICLTIIIVGVCVGIICPRICDDLQEREFEIFQSYNFISGEYRDAIIKVIINVLVSKKFTLLRSQGIPIDS